MKLDSAGNVYVLLQLSTDTTFGDYGLVKYSNSGNLIWSVRYNSPGNLSDIPSTFAVTRTGDVYITGTSNLNFYDHITTVKFDSSGAFVWAKTYDCGGNGAGANDLLVDKTGNIIVSGAALVSPNIGQAVIIKYTPAGDSLWVRIFNLLPQISNVNKMAIDNSNNIYTVGYYGSPNSDYLILKYNETGNLNWYVTYDGITHKGDIAECIALDSNRNIYVVGNNTSLVSLNYNTLLKISSSGILQWASPFSGIVPGEEGCLSPSGIVATPEGGSIYYATTCNNGGAAGYEIVTLKYNSVGDSVWIRRFSGGVANTSNYPTGLKVDKYGDIYVSGSAKFPTSGYNYTVIKYLANGVQQWVARYNEGSIANDIFIDTNRNVYLTGSAGVTPPPIAATIKYNQPNGIHSNNSQLPTRSMLHQNYPNPFNSSTIITYELPRRSSVRLRIFNMAGQLVETLVNDLQIASYYSILWNAENLASGIYFYTLECNSELIETRKLILVK